MIGGNAEIRGAVLVFNDLQNGLQYTDNRAVRAVFAFREPTQPIKMPKQFIGSVD
jgi:hypothetical protein